MKANGEVHLTDRETGKTVTHPTIQCVHCAKHWQPAPGSGRLRGFCTKCNGFVCGNPNCDHCMPWQQKQDNLEGGLAISHRPVIVQSLDIRGLSVR